MVKLGYQFEQGNLMPRNMQKAAEWYAKAALTGEPIGMYDLGLCFANGRGVPRSNAKAMQWLRKSADAGYAPAKQALSDIQARGVLDFLTALSNLGDAGAAEPGDADDAEARIRAMQHKIDAEQEENDRRQKQEETNHKLDQQYRRLLEN